MGWIEAIVSMCVVLIAHHLGFIDKAYNIAGEIARCPMCSVFWVTLGVLWYNGIDTIEAIALSFIMAYFSNWVAIAIDILSLLYERVWQRSRRLRRSRSRRK